MLFLFAFLLLDFKPAAPDAPLRQPQLAAHDRFVALAYGAGKEIRVAVSTDGGSTFAAPAKVAEVKDLMLGRHRGPRVALAGDSIVVTAVGAGGDLRVWRSTRDGKTWTAGPAINDVPGAAREGLDALASDGRGRLFAAWLDLRKQGTRIYGALSNDAGATWSPNTLVYESPGGTVCECCHPSVSIGEDGTIRVMWRNSLNGARDLYLAHSRDGVRFSPAAKLGEGTWPLNACPMDGGGLAASQGRVFTAWRRESAIYTNEPGRPERRIGTGKDVALAAAKGRAVAVWSSGPALSMWREGGAARTLAPHGAYPALVALGDGTILAAWEQDG
ncbi:MAG TPA: sialidase family protein, partial [Bryobacteraceae bacterium]|nr:sialidase family protein [Bryobacteraceae bacterium]